MPELLAIESLRRGDYKLTSWICNPAPVGRMGDWRARNSWDFGTRFHCYDFYISLGRVAPALYAGSNPAHCVHEGLCSVIFNALVDHLERLK